jgi:hypothetical protein
MIQKLESKGFVQQGWVTHFQGLIEHPMSPTPEASTADIVDGTGK